MTGAPTRSPHWAFFIVAILFNYFIDEESTFVESTFTESTLTAGAEALPPHATNIVAITKIAIAFFIIVF